MLCKDFGLYTLAERVETEEQLNIIKLLNIDYAQGYYFSPPVPEDEFEKRFLLNL
jgi:EAL domain-containing protein (putative c-di-GMP-specific phosphodiesterase class I)